MEMEGRIQQQLAVSELPDDLLLDFMYQSLDKVIVKHKQLEIHWGFEDIFKNYQWFPVSETTI